MGSERDRETELAATVAGPLDAAPSTDSPTALPTQTIAGRYEILGLLGAGGMGTVYKVRDRELDEIVALKTLRTEWIDAPGALDRFKREVKLARRVTHRNVARTFDIGEGATETFLTMEHVDGPSLTRVIDERGPFPVDEALRVAGAIAEALDAAHTAGVIHRDLKPDNVLLAKDGRVVVTDFGIARAQVADAGMTAAGGIVGTPAYMAPEQVEGAPVDARADLYALGLVLHEMLTGSKPFTGSSPFAIAAARLIQPPPDPSASRGDLPRALVDLVRKLLARRPDDRFPTAAAVRDALAAITPSVSRRDERPSAPPPRAPSAEVARSVAVFPMRAAGPSEDAWIAEGFTDDLLDALCMVRGLRVKARTTPLPGEEARAFGERMQVELVVDGTVRRAGDGVRISLRLTSVADGFQVWAQRYDGSLGDLLVTGDRAGGEIGRAAGSVATPSLPPPMRHGVDPAAIELYLRARVESRSFLDSSPQVHLLEKAIALAPDEPRFLAALAIAHARETFRPGIDMKRSIARATETAERAIALAPELAEPWIALAHVRNANSDSPGAMRALKRALRAGPSVGEVYDLVGRLLGETNRLEEALEITERALWIDPRLPFTRIDRLRVHALRGDVDRLERELEELRSISPTHYVLAAPRMSIWMKRVLHRDVETRDLAPFAVSFVQHFRTLVETGTLPQEARDGIAALIAQTPPISRPRRLFEQLRAEIYATMGELDVALDGVESSVRAGLEDFGWIERCPAIAPLRGHPRFEAQRAIVRARAEAVWAAWSDAG